MSNAGGEMPGTQANAVFLIGANRPGVTLLYKLLCLHPEVAYISNLEHRMPWLPVSVAGRYRLRRYSSKLKAWFGDGRNAAPVQRSLVSRVTPVPVEGEAVYGRCGLPLDPERGYLPDPRVISRLRERFVALQEAQHATAVVSSCTANGRRIPALHSVFPGARYVSLVPDGRQRVEQTEEIACGLQVVEPSRVLAVHFDELLEAPLEEMRRVLAFMGIERRLDYEWALKALKLGDQSPSWCSAGSIDQGELMNREQREPVARSGYAS